MGEIYRILCQDNKNTENQTSVILKIAPKHLMRREKFRLRDLFLREIMIYDEVSFALFDTIEIIQSTISRQIFSGFSIFH